ncbi:hypothetical protein CVT24_003302 [Panaeolus cyanescens]|uniref:Uncharacterized protein n=1 Tax=Panaeolus cyanescens TaxID=181874 RepID=A0A409YXI0_9AGAR|nr:hypothetical protein CVT24_003302 [Panaeolus cyanescens]
MPSRVSNWILPNPKPDSSQWSIPGTIRDSFPLEDKIQKYGRIVKLELDGDDVDEGDVMLGADMHTGMEDSRDATYVRYDCEIDLAAHRPKDDVVMEMQSKLFTGD